MFFCIGRSYASIFSVVVLPFLGCGTRAEPLSDSSVLHDGDVSDAESSIDADLDIDRMMDAESTPCSSCGCDIPVDMVCVSSGLYLSHSSLFDETREFFISSFLIDRFEVTNSEYRRCVQAGVCVEGMDGSRTRSDYFINPLYDEFPVVWVRWVDAETYCRWVGMRLPTSFEWEKAARGGCEILGEDEFCESDMDLAEYPWGNQPAPEPCIYANDGPMCVGDTSSVGFYEFDRSPYGAMDMFGNVTEWVNDWFSPYYFADAPEQDPTGPSMEYAMGDCVYGDRNEACRVMRGSNFATPSHVESRISLSGGNLPDYGSDQVGFRCARDVEAP